MEVVVISSDSSTPSSPTARSPSSDRSVEVHDVNVCEERTSRTKNTVKKRPIHNFSSSDDSDSECAPVFESKKLACEPAIDVSENDADFEIPEIEEACSQRGYVSLQVHDLLNANVLTNTPEKITRESKASKKKLTQEERERRMKEKEEKQVEKACEKALKKAASEAQKANRPGECMKYIQVLIDQRLLTEEYSGSILSTLQAGQIRYSIQEQLSEKTITWVKTVNSFHCDDDGEALDKQRKFKARCQTGPGAKQKPEVHHNVCQSDVEKALIEIQIFENCSHRFVETSQDLGTLIAQFTKALAEKEFKLEKQQKEQENLGWFASGDSRDTVKIDKSSNGLLRLWKQQLCQFNTASLDTAEAIVALYPSPKLLMQAYENCSSIKQGQLLLQDVAVRRAAGPLTSVRRIGPELSKKIYNFFTTENGELSLSQD